MRMIELKNTERGRDLYLAPVILNSFLLLYDFEKPGQARMLKPQKVSTGG